MIRMMMIAAVFAFSMSSQANPDFKVGLVEMQKALQGVETGKKARAALEGEFNKKKTELQKEEASIKKMHEDFQKQALVMNDAAKAKKQQEIQEKLMKFQEVTARYQSEIQRKEQELTDPIVKKLRKIIKDVAEKKGYVMVFEKNENTVLYSPDKDDLTDEVITAYNKDSGN